MAGVECVYAIERPGSIEALKVSEKRVCDWIKRGILRADRVNDQYRLHRSDLLERTSSREIEVEKGVSTFVLRCLIKLALPIDGKTEVRSRYRLNCYLWGVHWLEEVGSPGKSSC